MGIRKFEYLLIVLLATVMERCEAPVEFKRDNTYDPKGINFKPQAPDNIKVDFFDEEILEVTWKDNSLYETSFIIERQIENEKFMRVGQVGQNVESFIDTAHSFGKYQYRVSAVSDTSKSEFTVSNILEVTHWSEGPNLSKGYHVALPLRDGKVFLDSFEKGNEIYDPVTKTLIATGGNGREFYGKLALLQDGRIFKIGTKYVGGLTKVYSSIYDPKTGNWVEIGDVVSDHVFSISNAITLNNGNALVIGMKIVERKAVCEIFDTTTETFRLTTQMSLDRRDHTSTFLPNGKVLVVGGYSYGGSNSPIYTNTCEIFDPSTEAWTMAASMTTERSVHKAVLLDDGRVLVIGGFNRRDRYLNSCEIYDPTLDTWSTVSSMNNPDPQICDVTKFSDGKIFVLGELKSNSKPNVEIYEPTTDTWTGISSFPYTHFWCPGTATLLPNGRLLVTIANSSSIYRE